MPRILCQLPRLFGVFLIATLVLGGMSAMATAREITVFAAASLTNAIETLASTYEKQTGDKIRLSLASSSTLARQIAAGAPADIFISANEKWMDWLEDENLLIPNSRHDLLANRLVLIAPSDKALETRTISANTNLISWISPEDRIAVGDPDHVPAGIYAKSALISLDQWDAISPRLARADNVRAALALVERGEVPLGIVYQTDAGISDRVKIIATFPQDSHPAITYPAALIAGHADTKATKFFMWLLGDDAGRIFTDYGFEPIATPQSTVPDQ